MFRSLCFLAWVAATLFAGGCSKEKMSELVDQAKEQVSENVGQASQSLQQTAQAASDTAQQQLGLAGSMQFALDAPVTTKGCYVAFIAGHGGRPAVLQLRSYPTADQEAFPAALIQAQVEAQSVNDLVGKTVSAQAFVQAEPSGAVWHSVDGEPVQLTIQSYADKHLMGALTGKAKNTKTSQTLDLTGTIDGWLE